MSLLKIEIAGKKVLVEYKYNQMLSMCRDYVTDFLEPDMIISSDQEEIDNELIPFQCVDFKNGKSFATYSPRDIESTVIHIKLILSLICQKFLLLHGAAISLDNRCYIFMAPSGTGKTTHILNWKKLFPETIIINGDKPLINTMNKIVYGTPWCGKEGYNTNTCAPLSGVISLERGNENSITPITFHEMLPVFLQQTYIPKESELALKAYSLIGCFKDIPCYKLKCNMDKESARIAHDGIRANEDYLSSFTQ